MAEHADGSIIVDTEIDAQGFKAGSSELKGAIKSLNTKIQSLGPTFQKALSGNASSISTFDAKVAALESTISDIEAKMESLGGKRVPTEDYQWLTTEIEKAKNELIKLDEKQIKMEATGVKQNSRAWQSLQYDIDLAKRKIAEYEGEQAAMRADGTAFQMGSSTAEYTQLESALVSAKDRLAEMQAQAESARGSTSRLAQIGNSIRSVFSKIGAVGKKAFTGFVNGVKNGISKLKQFSKSSGGCMGAISKLSKKLTGLGSMLKRMALRKIMMAMLTAVKDGLNNLAQYSSQTNADLSALKSRLTQLKNSFATAFAPILTVVTPILTKLIGYLSTALTYIGEFFAALTGAKIFTKATAVQEDYVASLNNTSEAAENTQKQLAGFDELNVLSDSNSSSAADTSGTVSPSEMFEEVPIESSITDFVGKLKEAFKNGDYAGIGKIIGNGINTAVQKVKAFISWDNVGHKVTNGIKAVAQGFNSIIHTVDWQNIGDTVAQGFNTVINTLFLLITEFDWPGLATSFSESINGVILGIDWSKLGTTLSTACGLLLVMLRNAVSTLDWLSLGEGVADAFNAIDWVTLFSDLAGLLSDALVAALDLLIGFSDNLDWGKLGQDLWDSLVGIIDNIDWSEIISKAFHLLGSACGGLTATIAEFCKSLWEDLKQGFEDTKDYFNTYIEEAGGNVVEGIFKGIGDALKNIGNWIVENIWNPFIEGFKNAFGIHSPSTKMEEQGNFLVEGLLNGIKNTWDTITSFFSFEGLKNLKATISNGWTEIKNKTSTKWTEIKTTLTNKWNSIKTTAKTKWNSIKTTITNIDWSGVGSDICNGIKTGIDNGWTWLTDKVSNVATGLLDSAKDALGIHSPSRLFRDIVGLNIGYGIGEGIEASEGSVVKTVTGLADAIAEEANAGEYRIGGVVSTAEVDGALTGFSDKVANSFSTLLERLQAIADGVTFTVPVMATGTVVPYSSIGGNTNYRYGDLTVDTLRKVLTEVLNHIDLSTDITVTITNDPDRQFEAIVRKNNEDKKRRGGKSRLS